MFVYSGPPSRSAKRIGLVALVGFVVLLVATHLFAGDVIREIQVNAIQRGRSDVAHWGTDAAKYTAWGSHSNRLVPVYTFGTKGAGPRIDLGSYQGRQSPYRSQIDLRRLYGQVPSSTFNPDAQYFDQTNIGDIQKAALAARKKHIFLVVFDGMDWQTTQAAAIYNARGVKYTEGRGTGLHLLDYTADGTSQYGFMVTSPHDDITGGDVNTQRTKYGRGGLSGGYDAALGGKTPWDPPADPEYLIGKSQRGPGIHAYPDSAATGTAMTSGRRTYNGAINVDWTGTPVDPIAHLAQQARYRVGAVTSVPISHATPAASYARNVSRNDYQDLTRDLLGLPSVFHERPLRGLDVLIGAGWDCEKKYDVGQGSNYAAGNRYLAPNDRETIDLENGGRYVVAERTEGKDGTDVLTAAAEKAKATGSRLFGFFGVGDGNPHLPYRTADGNFDPVPGRRDAEVYTPADITENPTLAEMTTAAIDVLSRDNKPFWLMVEAGDVDWANHDNNLDNSIGAVLSGDAAVKAITDWVEANSNWEESLLIVTADHGHMLNLDQPEMLVPSEGEGNSSSPGMTDAAVIDGIRVMADGGASDLAPHGSEAALRIALQLRYDLLLDITSTADEKLVIAAPALGPLATGKPDGTIDQVPWSTLSQLDIGSATHPVFANERVQPLDRALDLIRDQQRHPVQIALRVRDLHDDAERDLIALLDAANMREQVFIIGHSQGTNALLKRLSPKLRTGIAPTAFTNFDLSKPEDFNRALRFNSVDLLWMNTRPTAEQIRDAEATGKQVWYVAPNVVDPQSLVKLPLAGIATAQPAIVRAALPLKK